MVGQFSEKTINIHFVHEILCIFVFTDLVLTVLIEKNDIHDYDYIYKI